MRDGPEAKRLELTSLRATSGRGATRPLTVVAPTEADFARNCQEGPNLITQIFTNVYFYCDTATFN